MKDENANMVGSLIDKIGYVHGRAGPTIERAKEQLLKLKAVAFVCKHYTEGYERGFEDQLKAEAKRYHRKLVKEGKLTVQEAAKQAREYFHSLVGAWKIAGQEG